MEPVLLDMVMMKEHLRQPMAAKEGKEFANSLLEGSRMKVGLKVLHDACGRAKDQLGELGDAWWGNFTKRHRHTIKASAPVSFPNCCMKWETYENFEKMYSCTYHNWVRCGITKELDEPRELGSVHNLSEDDEEKFLKEMRHRGNKTYLSNFVLLHPEGALAADEIGNNTNTTKDKLQGKERRPHVLFNRAQKIASETDCAWTVLTLTAMTGEAVCCVVIIEGKRFTAEELTGIDISAQVEKESWDFQDEDNHGAGKRYPGGPICHFRGNEILAFITFSDSGGITTKILKGILEHLDRCGVYNRATDPFTPTIQLDSHHSWFGIEFLQYCRQPGKKWDVTVGCPETTHLWQVQDASELNGENKKETYKAKENLLKYKRKMGLSIGIEGLDIIPLVNKAWHNSFAVACTDLLAIAERGWNPMNAALLHHPTIAVTKPKDQSAVTLEGTEETELVSTTDDSLSNQNDVQALTSTSSSVAVSQRTLEDLNMTEGLSKEYYTDVIMWAKDRTELKENVKKQVEEKTEFKEKARKAKQLSPGFLFSEGQLCLTSNAVFHAFKVKQAERDDKAKEVVKKHVLEYEKTKEGARDVLKQVKDAMLRNGGNKYNICPTDELTLTQIPVELLNSASVKKLLRIQYRKGLGDTGFSKLSVAEAREKWKEVRHRPAYSMEDFLLNEKKHAPALVEQVLLERQMEQGVTIPPLPLVDANPVGQQPDDPESDDDHGRDEAAEAMISLAGVAEL